MKKRNSSRNEKKKSVKSKPVYLSPVESTQQVIPLKELYNGIIVTTDRRYLKIIEIKPVAFIMKSPSDQLSIATAYAEALRVAPMNVQIISMTLPANLHSQIAAIDKKIAHETNEILTEVYREYRNTLVESQRDSVTRRFFMVFEYENQGTIFKRPSLDDVVNWLNTAADRVSVSLQKAGNEVVPYDKENPNGQTAEILYSLLNREKILSEPFEVHLQKVFERYFNVYGNAQCFIPPADYVAPDIMSFNDKRFIVVNNTFYSFLYIPSNGYCSNVEIGWLSPYINSYPGVDVTLYFNRIPASKVFNSIRRNLVYSKQTQWDVSDTSLSFDDASSAVQAGYYLKEGLASGQDFYYMSTLITVTGSSPMMVQAIINELVNVALQNNITLVEAKYEEEEAFMSSLPFARLDQSLYQKSKRNILTESIASTYPFLSFQLDDPDGIYMGNNLDNDSLALINIFNTKKFDNANCFIAGRTGAGKTFTLGLLAERSRVQSDIDVYMILPEKSRELKRLCNALDGEFITLAPGSSTCVNIMEIRKDDNDIASVIDGSNESVSKLTTKIEEIKTFVNLLIPDLDIEQKQLLDEACVETYRRVSGITEDNASLVDPDHPDRYKKMPILGDLRETLKTKPRAAKIYNVLSIFTDGTGKSFNGQTNVSLDNPFTIISTEYLTGDMLPIGIFLALSIINGKIRENITKKKMVICDEWWKLAYQPIGADYSMKLAKTIRGYGGSFIACTQQLTDILGVDDGKFGAAVLNNCAIKIMLGMDKDDAQKVQNILGLTDSERRSIINFDKGEGLIIAGDTHIPVRFKASQAEYNLLTTDREDLKRIYAMKKSVDESGRDANDAKDVSDNTGANFKSNKVADNSMDTLDDLSSFLMSKNSPDNSSSKAFSAKHSIEPDKKNKQRLDDLSDFLQ